MKDANAEWIRGFVRANPTATVDAVARAAHNEGHATPRGIIADLRRIVRIEMAAEKKSAERLGVEPETLIGRVKVPQCVNCGADGHYASECIIEARAGNADPSVVEVAVSLPLGTAREQIEQPAEEETVRPEAKLDQKPKFEMELKAAHPEARRRTVAGRVMRRQRLNELLEADPGADPLSLMAKIKEEFGVALDWRYVYATCRVAREIHQLPQIPTVGEHTRSGGPGEALPTYATPEEEYADTPEEELAWLAKQCADVMRAHGLTQVRMEVVGGRAKWTYEIVKREEGELEV